MAAAYPFHNFDKVQYYDAEVFELIVTKEKYTIYLNVGGDKDRIYKYEPH